MESQPTELSCPVPQARLERILYGAAILILPGLAFFGMSVAKPDWQSGRINDYAALLLNPQAALLFFPLLIYAIVSLWLVLIRYERFDSLFVVRFGIYTGILLAFQYMLVAAVFFPYSLAAGLVVVVVYWLAKKIGRRFGAWVGMVFVLLIFSLVPVAIFRPPSALSIAALWESLTFVPIFFLVTMASASPVVCFLIMLFTAAPLFRTHDKPHIWSGARFPGLAAWLAGYTAAWAYSIYQMFEMYNALPKQPPCYVVTAAAQGHPAFVGSQPVSTASGIIWVNHQLQTLKCAELALQALAPRLHRLVRFVYDIVGPVLARRLTHPLLADLAYISLKPAELLARVILRLLLPDFNAQLHRIYR